MADIILGLLIIVAIACAIGYLVRAKRRGDKCIGCPYSGSCGGSCSDKK